MTTLIDGQLKGREWPHGAGSKDTVNHIM